MAISVAPAWAGGGGANVAVIVNAESWASLTIANEYIALRDIPAANVVYLTGVPGFETVDVDVFRQKILGPALSALEQRGLGTQIDYLVYSADFPYGVNVASDIGDTKVHQVITKVGSLTGLTYLCQAVRGKSLQYLDPNSNRYYRPPGAANTGAEFLDDEEGAQKTATAIELAQQGKTAQALEIFEGLAKTHPKSVLTAYNIACCEAKLDHPEKAVKQLEHAVELGWWNVQHTQNDSDLASLHDREDFKQLIARMKDHVIELGDSQGFRTVYAWDQNNELVPPNRGVRYLISSMLGATSGRGTSVNEALESLRRAKTADGTHPSGTIYFMDNKNVRAETRSWAFPSAVGLLKEEGVAAEIISDGTILPRNKRSIAGLMAGYASFNLKNWGSTVVPGAFCEHLTSYGGVLKQGADQMSLAEWITAGATSSCGAVTEPYAVQWKFPTPFVHVHYARGCTLGEAYYQSVQMPYQLLLVGDPLCAPWANAPQFSVTGLRAEQSVKGRLTVTPRPVAEQKLKQFEFYIDGRRAGIIKPEGMFEFDTAALADGRHEMLVVAIDADSIESQAIRNIPFDVNNLNRQVKLTAKEAGVVYGKNVELDVEAVGAREVIVLQNGRPVGRLTGENNTVKGAVSVPSNMLGMGDVRFVALAVYGEDAKDRAQSAPAKVTLFPPRALTGVAKPRGELVEGVTITSADGKSTVVPTLAKAWQEASDVGQDEFTLETFLSVPSDDLYQLEFRSDSKVVMQLDGEQLTRPQGEGGDGNWKYAPLPLKRGWHTLKIVVSGKEANSGDFKGRIDVRFGGHGTQSLDKAYCQTLKQ